VTEEPAYEDFLLIPLRVHVLSAPDLREIDCRLSDADIARILGKVNRIWHKAGIHWGLESLVREPAAHRARFRLARELDGAENLRLYEILIPEASRVFDGLHVYYLHQFPVNGVHLEEDLVLVKETAELAEVEGGIDEPVPRVTAHELGHALGLSHRRPRTSLLASGTTGTRLTAEEVAQARAAARTIAGVAAVPAVRRAAREAEGRGDRASARRLWTWLAAVPGSGAAEAGRRRDALDRPAN
jgi:hypothetical protein